MKSKSGKPAHKTLLRIGEILGYEPVSFKSFPLDSGEVELEVIVNDGMASPSARGWAWRNCRGRVPYSIVGRVSSAGGQMVVYIFNYGILI